MTAPDLAAALLRDVPRYDHYEDGYVGTFKGRWMQADEVIAALSRALDPAIAERAGEVLEGVTLGPWEAGELTKGGSYRYLDAPDWGAFASVVVKCDGERQEEGEANARFIAWARNNVPALLAQNAALRAERDEADRRAGAAERELADKRDTISKISQARDEMKRQRGYDYTVSFDRVWKETCEKADRAEAAEAERDALAAEVKQADTMLVAEANASLERLARAEAAEAEVEKLRGALQIARVHVANNAEGWSVSRGAARDDLTIVDAALTTEEGK